MYREYKLPPFGLLLALLIAVPLIEIYLLLEVGSTIGVLPTVVLVIVTAVAGAALLRMQGLATLARIQDCLKRGEIPAIEMIEGLLLLITGVLLLTPGFFTDALGFACLVPPVRRHFAWLLAQRVTTSTKDPEDPQTFEGEFWRDEGAAPRRPIDQDPTDKDPRS